MLCFPTRKILCLPKLEKEVTFWLKGGSQTKIFRIRNYGVKIFPSKELQKAAEVGDYKLANHIFKTAHKEGTIKAHSHFAFHHLLMACSKAKNSKEAFKSYQKLKKFGLKPNEQTFRLLLNSVAEVPKSEEFRIEEKVEFIVNEMKKFGIEADSGFNNTYLKVLVFHSQDEKKVFELVEKMERDGQVDSATYTLLMQMYGEKGDVQKAVSVFERMMSKKILDLQAYNAILHICSQSKNRVENLLTFELYNYLEKDVRVTEDKRTFDILFRSMESSGERSKLAYLVDKMLKLSGDMGGKKKSLELDLPLIIQILKVAKNFPQLFEKIEKLVKRAIPEKRFKKKLDFYNNLIQIYGRLSQPGKAFQMFEEMKSKLIEPDAKTFTGLLVAARTSNNADLAWRTLSKTIPEFPGIDPRNPIFVRIVTFVAKNTMRKDILMEMKEFLQNYKPTPPDQRLYVKRRDREREEADQVEEEFFPDEEDFFEEDQTNDNVEEEHFPKEEETPKRRTEKKRFTRKQKLESRN